MSLFSELEKGQRTQGRIKSKSFPGNSHPSLIHSCLERPTLSSLMPENLQGNTATNWSPASRGATGDPVASVLFLQSLSTNHNGKLSLLSACTERKFLCIFTWRQSLSRFPSTARAGPSENCQGARTKLTPIIIRQGLERPSCTDLLHKKPL